MVEGGSRRSVFVEYPRSGTLAPGSVWRPNPVMAGFGVLEPVRFWHPAWFGRYGRNSRRNNSAVQPTGDWLSRNDGGLGSGRRSVQRSV